MANRKLQTEIERTLKKVTEGLEVFHDTLEKLQSASTPAQKEKIEVELKKEIKKLQRLRDQIKTWQTLSELKDKQAINEARRSIELEMERFKVLEKEMKIKAYSKEGLSQAAKLDPRELEKLKVAQWINAAVDKLSTQTDALEAELEALQLQTRKTKRLDGDKQERLEVLPESIERHKTHVRKLEQLLRLVENDKYGPDEVNSIKDDVDYYIEANQDADFIPDDDLYEQFDLVEDMDEVSDDDSDLSYADDSEESGSTSTGGQSSYMVSPSASSVKKIVAMSTTDPLPASSPSSLNKKKSLSSIVDHKSSSSVAAALAVPTPIPSATVTATTAKKPSSPPTVISSIPLPVNLPSSMPNTPTTALNSAPSSIPSMVPKVSGPSFASAIAKGATPQGYPATTAITTSPTGVSATGKPTNASILLNRPSAASLLATSLPPIQTKPLTAAPAAALANTLKRSLIPLPGPYEEFYTVMQKKQGALTAAGKTRSPKDLMVILESSYTYCPDGYEMERSKTFTPKQPFSVPSHYPSHPPAILENPAIFERFELDTLFFIFYYQQKTYAQYLAARELKRQSWRFHKKYLTWFQRHEEPKTLTDDYEQGTYIYFDYEGNWCQRKKSEFTFEYRYLEDEETV